MNRLRRALGIAAWAAGLALFSATTRPFPTVELVAGAVLALAAGVPLVTSNFREARLARFLAWVNCIGGLLFAAAFAPDMFLGAWLAGVCVFGLLVAVEKAIWLRARQIVRL
jgi:hypothetical protein